MPNAGLVNRIHVLDGRVRITHHTEQIRLELNNTTPQGKYTWNIDLKYLGYVKLLQARSVGSDYSRTL